METFLHAIRLQQSRVRTGHLQGVLGVASSLQLREVRRRVPVGRLEHLERGDWEALCANVQTEVLAELRLAVTLRVVGVTCVGEAQLLWRLAAPAAAATAAHAAVVRLQLRDLH